MALAPKPFLDYPALVQLLAGRGMHIPHTPRAERKLAQLGYYRLSGFWYPARSFPGGPPGPRLDAFEVGTSFDSVVALYQFDKRLRLLMLDAIERVEVHFKTVIAHEIGRFDPMAYLDVKYIVPKFTQPHTTRSGVTKVKWADWSTRQQQQVRRSREDCIAWHMQRQKPIPFWVAVEAWDFGLLSEYFEMLKASNQTLILKRLGLGPSHGRMVRGWLQEINLLRNRCAHHTRIWNQVARNPLTLPGADPFFAAIGLDQRASERLYGLVTVLWFLLQKIAPASSWIRDVAELLATKPSMPGCTYAAMGFPTEDGFQRSAFGV